MRLWNEKRSWVRSILATAALIAAVSTRVVAQNVSDVDPAVKLTQSLNDAVSAAEQLSAERDAATTRAVALEDELAKLRASTQPAPKPDPATQVTADLFVDGKTGDDKADGSAAKPLKSINAAAARVKPGQTILIRPGVYRESIQLTKGGSKGNPITFRAEKPNTVFVDGTDVVTKWAKVEADVYATPWGHSFEVGKLADGSPKRYFGALPPLGFCEQMWQSGRGLTRIMGRDAVDGKRDVNAASPGKSPGTFWIDYAAKMLYVCPFDGADPNTVEMVATTRDRLLLAKVVNGKSADANYVTVQNINFRDACNFPQRGAVTTSTGWRLEDVKVEHVSAVGVWVKGDDVNLLRVVAENNGQAGIGGSGATNSLIKDCVTRGNNTKGIGVTWEAGGGKFSRVNNLRFENYLAEDNLGPGLWFDIDNKTVSIKNSTFRRNRAQDEAWQGSGVCVEISFGPVTIENCTFDKNAGAGVAVFESGGVVINSNTFVGTGVQLREMNRKGYSLMGTQITNNRFTDRTATTITTAQGSWNAGTIAAKQLVINGNTYDAAKSPVAKWGSSSYANVDAFRAAIGVETGP